MNSSLNSIAGLAVEVQHSLNAHLLLLIIAIPLAVLLVLLFAVISATTLAQPDVEQHEDASSAAMRAALSKQAVARTLMPPVPASEPQNRAASILLVDDSAVARARLLKLFQAAGFDATVVRDGVEALEALSRRHFSVLITDLEMPNMNGFELIAAVQGSLETEDIPIIAITGHDELQARVHEFGRLYGIFKKPWNDRELINRVRSLAALRVRPDVVLG